MQTSEIRVGRVVEKQTSENGGFRATFRDALSPLSWRLEQAIVCCKKPFLFEGEKTLQLWLALQHTRSGDL